MTLFLKILSFPIRFVIFILFAVVSLILFLFNYSAGIILVTAAGLLSIAGKILSGLVVLCIGGYAALCLLKIYEPTTDELKSLVLPFVIIIILSGLLAVMPFIAEKLITILAIVSAFLWRTAKIVITCNN